MSIKEAGVIFSHYHCLGVWRHHAGCYFQLPATKDTVKHAGVIWRCDLVPVKPLLSFLMPLKSAHSFLIRSFFNSFCQLRRRATCIANGCSMMRDSYKHESRWQSWRSELWSVFSPECVKMSRSANVLWNRCRWTRPTSCASDRCGRAGICWSKVTARQWSQTFYTL